MNYDQENERGVPVAKPTVASPLQVLGEDASGLSRSTANAHHQNLIGQMVWTGVHVCGEWHRMAKGRVVRQDGNIYHVDVMSHHGGAPWVRMETHVERID